ncbi:hypothetical protein FEM48_Zijuj12G0121900 [Ziziphus jujuba var. spinosa]|uniref:Leucine-rich repeat receptor-like serine/threonine-protein kinase At3g14840 n=1 Tax=Ziziphus jujuba var. spinosa TaxID=714518 RepID=A0A978UD91_ZIZJJ|nr:hypothetical protein FEM48_Zijuj12G0121900 [Ziziphus jujuba var. spinosa]
MKTMFLSRLLLGSLLIFCLSKFASAAAQLPQTEVKVLQQVAKKLGKTNWNFSVDPCSGEYGWFVKNPVEGFDNALTCNCSFSNDTVCHVTSIALKAQSLPGTLPLELAELPYLQEIDLSRNYLNGTIPPEWGSLSLVNISLLGNRVTGSIPKEIANITTLKSLILRSCNIIGELPEYIGEMKSLKTLFLTGNMLSGPVPQWVKDGDNM